MPKVEWSAWVILAAVMYGGAILAGVGAYIGVKKLGKGKALRGTAFLLATLVVAGGLNWLSHSSSASPPTNLPKITALDVMSEGFGLKSGEKYKLMLGDRMAGSDLEVTSNRHSQTATETSGSKLSISFTTPNRSHYIVEIPAGPIEFVTDEDSSKASVVMYLENPPYDDNDYGYQELVYESPCTTIIQSGYLACDVVREYKSIISQKIKDAGLNTYVSRTFKKAIVTLPCENYIAILVARGVLGSKDCG